jgi:hypothetical protein
VGVERSHGGVEHAGAAPGHGHEGHSLVDDVGGDLAERLGRRPVGQGHRRALVSARRHRRLERHGTQQRHPGVGGQLFAATLAEQGVRVAVVAAERAHVLDDARHAQVALAGHADRPDRHLLGGARRRGDDDDLGPGQQLGHAHLHVTGARGHVDE